MKKRKYGGFISILLVMLVLAVGCGAKSDMNYETMPEESENAGYTSMTEMAEDTEITSENKADSSIQDKKEGETVTTNRKLIRRMNMNVETLEFDQLLISLTNKVNSFNGYMESSEISGNTYLRENNSRYAHMVIRIPSDKLNEFVLVVEEIGNVTYTAESTEDITLQYVDVESHKEALKIEQERLLEILKDAENLEYILKIEKRLSEVRYEIGSYESQLRTYDNLVDYSTLTLSIQEVQHITPVQDETVLDRMKSGLDNTFFELKTSFINFAVWFVTNLPYLIIWGAIFIGIGFIIRKQYKKKGIYNHTKNSSDGSHKNPMEEDLNKTKKQE